RSCPGWTCSFSSGTSLGIDTTSPYSVTWNSMPTNGTYTVLARATDDVGNTADSTIATVTVDNATAIGYDSTSSTTGAGSTTLSWSHTVGNAGARVLVVGIEAEWTSNTCQPSGVTYGGVA